MNITIPDIFKRRTERDVRFVYRDENQAYRTLLVGLMLGVLWMVFFIVPYRAWKQKKESMIQSRFPESVVRVVERGGESYLDRARRLLAQGADTEKKEPQQKEDKVEQNAPPQKERKDKAGKGRGKVPVGSKAVTEEKSPKKEEMVLLAYDFTDRTQNKRRPKRARLHIDAVTGLPVIAKAEDGSLLIGSSGRADAAQKSMSVTFGTLVTPDGRKESIRAIAVTGTKPWIPAQCRRIRNLDLATMMGTIAASGLSNLLSGLSLTGSPLMGVAMGGADTVDRVIDQLRDNPMAESYVCMAKAGTAFRIEYVGG